MEMVYPIATGNASRIIDHEKEMIGWSAADKLLVVCARQDFRPVHLAKAIALCRQGDVDWEAEEYPKFWLLRIFSAV